MQELSKDDIWQAVEFVKKKWIPPYGMPTQRVFRFQTSATNVCWEILDENLLDNLG